MLKICCFILLPAEIAAAVSAASSEERSFAVSDWFRSAAIGQYYAPLDSLCDVFLFMSNGSNLWVPGKLQ